MKRAWRTAACLATALAFCSVVVPMSAAGTASVPSVRAWLLTRVTNRASSYVATVGWRQDADHPGWAASVELFSHSRTGYAGLDDSTENLAPSAYAKGTAVGCGGQPSGTCFSPLQALAVYEAFGKFASGAGAPTNVLVVVSGITPTLTLGGSGWRVAKYAHRIQRAVAASSAAAGLEAGDKGTVELAGSSALKGGSRGSVAIAQPSCQNLAVQPIAVGIGTATLHGGTTTPSLSCPSANSRSILAAITAKGVTWRLDEPTVGYAPGPTRLVVVDL